MPQFALDALNNEHVFSRRTPAKRLRLLIFGRIVKRLKPLHGRKLDDNLVEAILLPLLPSFRLVQDICRHTFRRLAWQFGGIWRVSPSR